MEARPGGRAAPGFLRGLFFCLGRVHLRKKGLFFFFRSVAVALQVFF